MLPGTVTGVSEVLHTKNISAIPYSPPILEIRAETLCFFESR